ncbi:MAG: hypothetical protein V2J51_11040 [Erythrobacter sp.]|jgi:hypothetical protein|nr:hypothetical protein [Erythrobacter sp.]
MHFPRPDGVSRAGFQAFRAGSRKKARVLPNLQIVTQITLRCTPLEGFATGDLVP